jgi:hypothetical protein
MLFQYLQIILSLENVFKSVIVIVVGDNSIYVQSTPIKIPVSSFINNPYTKLYYEIKR